MDPVAPPATAKPIPPDPLTVQELQIKDKMAEAALITANATVQRDQTLGRVEAEKLQQGRAKLIQGALDHDRREKRQDEDTAARIQQGKAKLIQGALDHDRRENREDTEAAARIDVAQRQMELEETMRPKELRATVTPRP